MSLGYGKRQEDCRFSFCHCHLFFHQHGFGFISEWGCSMVVRRISVWLLCFLFLSFWAHGSNFWKPDVLSEIRKDILTRHWKITSEYMMWVKERINCFSSLSFIQSKVRSDSKWLNYTRHMRIYVQTPVSYVRLKVCPSSLKFYIAIPCCCVWAFMLVVPTVVCVLSIRVYNTAEIWKLLLWLPTASCLCCEMG